MASEAQQAVGMAEKKVAAQLGISEEEAAALVRPALERCAKIASELAGRPIAASMEALMSLGPEHMKTIQAELSADFQRIAARKKAEKAAFERAPAKNKFI